MTKHTILFGFLKIKSGCVLLGAVSLMLSIVLNLSTISLLANGVSDNHLSKQSVLNESDSDDHIPKYHGSLLVSGSQTLEKHEKEAILGVALAIGVILFCVSILLIVGVKKSKPGFVLSYFAFGVFLSIVVFVSALLELIKLYWMIAISEFIFIAIYIPCLVMVYSVHEILCIEKKEADLEQLLDDSMIL